MTNVASENVDKQLPLEDKAHTSNTYTTEQVREIYNEGFKSGYISAIKTIRSNINDYLDQLIVAVYTNQHRGE